MSQTRDRGTGRYKHCFCWQGYDSDGHEWSNCCDCGLWQDNNTKTLTRNGPKRTWNSPEKMARSPANLVYGTGLELEDVPSL